LWRLGGRCHDFASPFYWRLLPWYAQHKSIISHFGGRIARGEWLELDRQLARLDLDANDVVADEVSVITFCGIPEIPADDGGNESLDLGRRHPPHRSGTLRLSVEEG
jgi:hypothetical protein